MSARVTYRLPLSQVVVSGTVRRTVDAHADTTTWSLVSADVAVLTAADLSRAYEVEAPHGWFRTTNASFSTTDDGRLTSASATSTGEVVTVLTAVASIAGSVAGAVALSADRADANDDSALTAYGAEHDREAKSLKGFRAARARTQDLLHAELMNEGCDLGVVRSLRQQVAYLDEQLVPLEAQFTIWRSSKISTHDLPFQVRADLTALATGVPGGAAATPDRLPTTLGELWQQYGYALTVDWLEGDGGGPRPPLSTPPGTADAHTVLTRRPELVEIAVHRRRSDQTVCLTRSRQAVAHSGSQIVEHKLEKSWFGRRQTTLGFDDNGFVDTVTTERSSGAAAALTSLAGLPASFASGVGGATSAATSLAAASRAGVEAETARLDADIENRKQKLVAAGLQATAADAVELQRLEQLKSILEAQTAISGTNPSLVAALTQRAGGDLDWYRPPPAPEPTAPQVIRIEYGSSTPVDVATPPLSPPPLGGGGLAPASRPGDRPSDDEVAP